MSMQGCREVGSTGSSSASTGHGTGQPQRGSGGRTWIGTGAQLALGGLPQSCLGTRLGGVAWQPPGLGKAV